MSERDRIESADTIAASSDATNSFALARPKLAGRYELLGLLGTGGMGAVYRVRDSELGEIVALKMLRPEWAKNPAALERFRQEVRLARRVTHTNVARTFDIGEHEGERFLTMECVEGASLASVIAERGPMKPADAVAIGRAICEGLSAAHLAGVVHRDLKPENVLIAKDGRVVVTDFGIARAGDGSESAIVGTPAYMAPEQLVPRALVDNRADIYAFGAVLYEMLAGERAWKGDAPMLLLVERARATDILGRLLSELGALDESIVRLRIALDLDSSLIGARQDLARVYAMQVDFAAADRELDAITPGEPSVARDVVRARLALWRREMVTLPPTGPNTYLRIYEDFAKTEILTDEHRALMRTRVEESTARLRPLLLQRNAELFALSGDHEAAIDSVRPAIESDLIDLAWMERCPLFTDLRKKPEWEPLHRIVADRAERIFAALGRA